MLPLLLRNLLYHRRGNFAVFLGVVVATAVLTGALLVGDSLRGSLRALALSQLGWVDEAMVTGRFFREELATELGGKAAAAVLLQGSASKQGPTVHRAGKVTVLGVDEHFWPEGVSPVEKTFWNSRALEAAVSASLARGLNAHEGDDIVLSVQKADKMPRETIFSKRKSDDVLEEIVVKVRHILPDDGMAGFTLKPTPEPVRNVFVPRRFLQERLKLTGRANALLVGGSANDSQAKVAGLLTLDDWNLKLQTPDERARAFVRILDPRDVDKGKLKKIRWNGRVPDDLASLANAEGILDADQVIAYFRRQRNYLSLESNQMYLDNLIVQAAFRVARVPKTSNEEIARIPLSPGTPGERGRGEGAGAVPPGPLTPNTSPPSTGERGFQANQVEKQADQASNQTNRMNKWKALPILVYLADSIADGRKEIPYAVMAGVQPHDLAEEPLAKTLKTLKNNEIALAQWPQSPLRPLHDDLITVSYFAPDSVNHLEKRQEKFLFRETVPLQGAFDDPDLTPEFEGITDKLEMANWDNPPFPFDAKRVNAADEEFWKRYRATPRAYVTLETAQRLWGSRFGNLTSLRLEPGDANSSAAFRTLLQKELDPEQGGFVMQKVKELALRSGGGATDFGVLFLAFSLFLIVAALLLVGLLFRLNIERRAGEMGVLSATGWTRARVRLLILGEGMVLSALGAVVGLAGAWLYADLMLRYLQARWPGGESLSFLHFHAEPKSFLFGYLAAVIISVLTILWATRILAKTPARLLLAGQTSEERGNREEGRGQRRARGRILPMTLGVGAVACVVAGVFVRGHEAQALSFFGSGALLLISGLMVLARWLRSSGRRSSPQPRLAALGVRNAGRHLTRSVLTAGLLAAATFLIVAVESFHKEPAADFYNHDGGSGGFPLLAESDVPLFQDLNQASVRAELELDAPLQGVRVYSCRVRAGDDASCLNLYQPLRPRIVGVPHSLVERGGFAFSGGQWTTAEQKKNPWLLLESSAADGTIPVFADANTAQWILKVGLGDIVHVPNNQGETIQLKIVGLLSESIFQSELVMAESQFLKSFPREQGFSFFLIDGPKEKSKTIELALENALKGQGFFVSDTAQRVQAYLAVENTYLATFQALGGLGLLLGAAGLAVVLLRGVWERRGELALLRALGFRKSALAWLVLAENLFLLLSGLTIGAVAALAAVAPHLTTEAGDPRLLERLALLLGLVIVVGLAAGSAAAMSTMRTPILTALRRE